ncbi:hypothetical protein ACHRVW_07600 [Flavobacterium collinsii]|uniref:hypothetical protein n=1 Tax=Flavobacterium collinsii TaxID=1114861 RepID=UPI0037579AD4
MKKIDEIIKELEFQKLEIEIENLKKPVPKRNIWNSLEVSKFIVSLILPVTLFYITYETSERLKKIEKNEEKNYKQNIISVENNKRIYELRFEIYQIIALKLNEIYCYYYYVGNWKELSPRQIIENKRYCDQIMYSYQYLFSPEFFKSYLKFFNDNFDTFSGQGKDAKLLTDFKTHKKYYSGKEPWKESWKEMFDYRNDVQQFEIRKMTNKNYNTLLTLLPKELNIKEIRIDNIFKDFKPK